MSIKDLLKGSIPQSHLRYIRRSFEIIGNIVVIEIPNEVISFKQEIIKAILARHKHVKTILRKIGEVSGEHRVAKYEIIYGNQTETMVKEFGCKFLVDPTKVYYSVKLSSERQRIAKQVKSGEKVLVMFAGVGPFPILISKLANPELVIGIEINPHAVNYFRENIKLNKVENTVRVYEGDVREILPKLNIIFDRIIMPAPYSAKDFVYLIKDKIKVGGTVHYYTFESINREESLPHEVEELFKRNGLESKVIYIRKCGSFAPYVNRYVADVKIIGRLNKTQIWET